MESKRICECCHEKYEPTCKTQRYCSIACACKGKMTKCICVVCGKPFNAKVPAKYCSHKCENKASYAKRGYAPKYAIRTFTCEYCGKEQKDVYCEYTQKYCSRKCGKHAQDKMWKAKRRAELKKATVSYDKLLEKQNGLCGICGNPILERRETNTAWAGTIDHIKPLSVGGVHSEENCQAAHRICNSIKGQEDKTSIDWENLSETSPNLKRQYNKYIKTVIDRIKSNL